MLSRAMLLGAVRGKLKQDGAFISFVKGELQVHCKEGAGRSRMISLGEKWCILKLCKEC